MKNILCLVIILLGGLGIAAQEEKALTESQFEAIYQSSRAAWSLEKWKGKPFRMKTETSSSVEGRPQTDYSSKSTIEYASPTDSRGIFERALGDKKTKTEAIRFGDKYYFRKDGEDWKEGAPDAPAAADVKASSEEKTATERVEYRFLGTEKLNGQTVRVYAKNVKTKRAAASDGQETVTLTTHQYWIGEDGVLLKSNMIAESRTGTKTHRTLLTQAWEFDETIKIAAPLLSAGR